VAEHVTAGLRAVVPDVEALAAPVADGGDGTVDVVVAAASRPYRFGVADPLRASVYGLGEAVLAAARSSTPTERHRRAAEPPSPAPRRWT
jgi:glycerate kinase